MFLNGSVLSMLTIPRMKRARGLPSPLISGFRTHFESLKLWMNCFWGKDTFSLDPRTRAVGAATCAGQPTPARAPPAERRLTPGLAPGSARLLRRLPRDIDAVPEGSRVPPLLGLPPTGHNSRESVEL